MVIERGVKVSTNWLNMTSSTVVNINCSINPLLPKSCFNGFNTCPLKFIHNSFDPGATELKFYSERPGVSNDVSCEAKINSQENQHHLEYTKEVIKSILFTYLWKNLP